jgi:hypothetical protein
MSWDELRTRVQQEFAKRHDAALYRLGVRFRGDEPKSSSQVPGRFFFSPSDLPQITALLRDRLPMEAEQLVERAEQICAHRFDLLGYRNLDCGQEIDWHLDAAHGKRSPRKPWYRIRYLDFGEVGDAKVTWELNRHQHLVTLAKAYCLANEERYASEVLRQWYRWREENPYPLGINWASSLEVAFRSLSWLWMRSLLASCPLAAERFRLDLDRSLALNGQHIERFLSTYFSPNTHLLGEGVALFFIGTLCRQIPAAQRWQRRGWEIVLREAERQVQPDGMHFEQSTYYHVYALDFFLHARILAASNQIPIPAKLDQTLLRMLEVLRVLGQARVPRFGDDDGGRVFDPQRNRAEHLLDPLVTGAVVFRRGDLKAVGGGLREETVWLLGPEGVARFDELIQTPSVLSSVGLESSGIYVMASSGPPSQQLVIEAGPQGTGTAGHSHADALSVHLTVDGQEWLVDPGTYVYVGSEADRNLFRGTSGHNTLQVDGSGQAESNPPFSWRSLANARAERWTTGETFDLFVGAHTGYTRLSKPVIHRRSVFHLKSRFSLVRDLAAGQGVHQLDLFWHLSPRCVERERVGSVAIWVVGQQALALVAPEGHPWSQEIDWGWFSPAYGVKEPSPVLKFSTKARLPIEFATLLLPLESAREQVGVLTRLDDGTPNGDVRGYQYAARAIRHSMFFAERSGRWELGGWASDAQFVYCCTGPQGRPLHMVLCDGSYLEIDGRLILAAERGVARCEWQGTEAGSQVFCSDPRALKLLPAEKPSEAEAASTPGFTEILRQRVR